jgi:hypothetical protein
MKYDSPYLHKSFRPYLIKRLTLPFLGLLLLSIATGASFFSKIERLGIRRGMINKIEDAIDGLHYFGWNEFLVILFILCLGMLLAGAVIYHDNKSTKMIVGIEEDYENKKITIYTKDFLDKVRRINIPLGEFKIQLGGRQKDGLSKHGHLCYENLRESRK